MVYKYTYHTRFRFFIQNLTANRQNTQTSSQSYFYMSVCGDGERVKEDPGSSDSSVSLLDTSSSLTWSPLVNWAGSPSCCRLSSAQNSRRCLAVHAFLALPPQPWTKLPSFLLHPSPFPFNLTSYPVSWKGKKFEERVGVRVSPCPLIVLYSSVFLKPTFPMIELKLNWNLDALW